MPTCDAIILLEYWARIRNDQIVETLITRTSNEYSSIVARASLQLEKSARSYARMIYTSIQSRTINQYNNYVRHRPDNYSKDKRTFSTRYGEFKIYIRVCTRNILLYYKIHIIYGRVYGGMIEDLAKSVLSLPNDEYRG